METIDHKHEIYHIYRSSCTKCSNGFNNETFICKAFPKGIPDDILEGINKHLKALPGQGNDIVFEAK